MKTKTLSVEAGTMDFGELNAIIRDREAEHIVVNKCYGQRYIASGSKGRDFVINGTPGNALGAYMNGSRITVFGNCQEATGDTMNDGEICIHGGTGDCTGYAMRGGSIFIRDSSGYRAGVHMKAYEDKYPALIIGGAAGSFLGEYQAGGLIMVLGIGVASDALVGRFCGTGMHGGIIVLRTEHAPFDLPPQVAAASATQEERAAFLPYIKAYCERFGRDYNELASSRFTVLKPNSNSPYKKLYTAIL